MSERDLLYLTDIRDSIDAIAAFTCGGRDAFMRDRMVRDAVIRNLEIIGEASSRLSTTVTADDAVPWRRIKAFRNVLVHEYSGIDMNIVWQVVEKDLPPLAAHVDRLLAGLTRR